MKKVLLFVLLMLVPIVGDATTFELKNIDMNITIDESEWYVFTPDNILDNPELEDLGLTYEYMYESFQNNQAYLDAVLFFYDSEDYIELFVRRVALEDIRNLTNYDDAFINRLGQVLADEQNANYEIYRTDYPFILLDYMDQGFYLQEYYMIVNGYGYTITVQKPEAFSSEDTARVEEIVDSVSFDADLSLEEPNSKETNKEVNYIIIGVASVALVVVILVVVIKNKKGRA